MVLKRIDNTSAWTVYDNKRGVNGNPYELFLNSREAEYTGTSYFNIDILSNGFKIRLTDASINASGGVVCLYGICRKSIHNINRNPNNSEVNYVGISRIRKCNKDIYTT